MNEPVDLLDDDHFKKISDEVGETKEPLITNMGLIQEVLEELYAMDDKPGLAEAVTKWEGLEQDLKDWEDANE